MRDPWLHEFPLLGVEDVLGECRRELAPGRVRRLVLTDQTTHAHHVCERPVRDALAVRQTAAPVPVDVLDDPVEVLVELPGEPRLADPGDARHRDEVRAAVLGCTVEHVLDQLQLAVPPDERRLEPGGAHRAGPAGDDAERAKERDRLQLALQLVSARIRVRDRLLGRAPCHLADQHRARLCCRLDPCRRVDEIARHHPLPLGAECHGGLARQHPDARLDVRPELRDRLDELEGDADRALGVVLGRDRRAPDRHDGVPDELLDRAAVPSDQGPRKLEVAGEKLAGLLCVARLRGCREPHQVGEEHRDKPTLGLCDRRRLRRTSICRVVPHSLQNFAPDALLVPAGGAHLCERSSALVAELRPGRIIGAAGRAVDHVAPTLVGTRAR